MIDLQALTGDSTDNVPGIPGIGPKTAAQLLEEFGDLDTLLARAGEIKQVKRRENIIANAELARLSRELVTLKTDVPVEMPLDALDLHPQDGPRLVAFLKAMEFTTLTRRVAILTDTDAEAVEPASVPVEWGAAAHGPDLDKGEAAGAAARADAAETGEETAADAAEVLRDAPPLPDTGPSPQMLADARAQAFASAPIDRSTYATIRDLATLESWIAAAREAGWSPSIRRPIRSMRCRPISSDSRSPLRTMPRIRPGLRFAPPMCRCSTARGPETCSAAVSSKGRSRSGRRWSG